MKRLFRSLLTAAVLGAAALPLGGCFLADAFSTAQAAANQLVVEVVDLKTAQQRAFQLKSGYGALLEGATLYANLPRCGSPAAVAKPACSSQPVLDAMVKLSRAADTGTQALEDVVRGTPNNASLLSAAVNAAEASFNAFKQIVAVYRPKGA